MTFIPRTNVVAGTMSRIFSMPGAPVAGTNEVQTMTINAASGTYRLDFGGGITAPLNFNALAAAIQTALINLANIPPASVVVSGTAPTIVFTFQGDLAAMGVPLLKIVNSTLNVAPTIVRTTPGVAPTLRGAAKGAIASRADTGASLVNTGTAITPVWTAT